MKIIIQTSSAINKCGMKYNIINTPEFVNKNSISLKIYDTTSNFNYYT